MKKFITDFLGRKRGPAESGVHKTGEDSADNKPTAAEAVDKNRDSVRTRISAAAFEARAASTRRYGETRDRIRASITYHALLEDDEALKRFPEAIQNSLRDILVELITAARASTKRAAPENFYHKFSEIKAQLEERRPERYLLLISLATWTGGPGIFAWSRIMGGSSL